uniref:Uncharacterized protein LOC112817396 n=1 Tax=Callorhinus ursinus TaxID=34884 RepID=A0A3Q7NPL0_CALUR|nr:uncharacterized protein LOC112817396 [Callorhinus ursinus]
MGCPSIPGVSLQRFCSRNQIVCFTVSHSLDFAGGIPLGLASEKPQRSSFSRVTFILGLALHRRAGKATSQGCQPHAHPSASLERRRMERRPAFFYVQSRVTLSVERCWALPNVKQAHTSWTKRRARGRGLCGRGGTAEGWTEPEFLAAGSLPISGRRPEPSFSLKSWGRERSHGVHVLLSAGRAQPEKVSSRRVPAAARADAPREGAPAWAGLPWRHEEGALWS